MAKSTDKYANVAALTLIESAAGTMTYQELLTGVSLGRQTGILIDQIEYLVPTLQLEKILATGDDIEVGWFVSNTASDFDMNDRRQIHQVMFNQGTIIGTPASGAALFVQPIVFQFFPPMIVAAPRIFLGAKGSSLGSAMAAESRIYFRYIDLTSQEYIELAEAFVLAG